MVPVSGPTFCPHCMVEVVFLRHLCLCLLVYVHKCSLITFDSPMSFTPLARHGDTGTYAAEDAAVCKLGISPQTLFWTVLEGLHCVLSFTIVLTRCRRRQLPHLQLLPLKMWTGFTATATESCAKGKGLFQQTGLTNLSCKVMEIWCVTAVERLSGHLTHATKGLAPSASSCKRTETQ